MREILFRGKNSAGKWLYGVFICTKHWKSGETLYKIIELDIHHIHRNNDVSPDTVSEYTGMYDKNGIRIFEGDIVNCCEPRDWSIEYYDQSKSPVKPKSLLVNFDTEYACFQIGDYGLLRADRYKAFEVIGNKWDNPELLEAQDAKAS
jgi:uncharacterized phage protein (TIGR01671 family)